MNGLKTSPREFLKTSAGLAAGFATSSVIMRPLDLLSQEARPVVSAVKIEKVKRDFARPNVVPWEAISAWFGRQEIV